MDRKSKFLYAGIWITIGTAIIMMVSFFYIRFYPFKTVVFNTPEFKILNENKEVKRGEVLKFEIDTCKYINQSATVSRAFVNGLIFNMPAITTNAPLGCNVAGVSQAVPAELPPGKYKLRSIFIYDIRGIRTITHTIYTEEFTVIE